MTYVSSENLENAVSTICCDVEDHVQSEWSPPKESGLWSELTVCLLSSQVSFDVAHAASTRIYQREILSAKKSKTYESIHKSLASALHEPLDVNGRKIRYRFHLSKADQLARTWTAINKSGGIEKIIESHEKKPEDLRNWLIEHSPGIGPKQASMFMRNCGISYDLAILDRHVINYMDKVGLIKQPVKYLSSIKSYKNLEIDLQSYAKKFGFKVGLLDWAIWIVMRAKKDLETSRRNA